MNRPGRGSSRRALCQTAVIAFAFSFTQGAEAKTPLSAEGTMAKTSYIVNQTSDENLLDVATDEFKSWGRFTISNSRDDADLVVVFTHRNGMDQWGNLGITQMDVYVKSHNEPAFTTTDAWKLIV